MRLTKLKLAGFKSFVDPTAVALPGQLVGVVGPNGCGKSNIMDAVRWVLGESKASELRGESMQDVIFNGSTNRKPVSRASVELIFDKLARPRAVASVRIRRTVGQARADPAGPVGLLHQHLKVRRKDITDLFLGTGLGRAPTRSSPGHDLSHHRGPGRTPCASSSRRRPASPATRSGARNAGQPGRYPREPLRVEDIREELGHQIGRSKRRQKWRAATTN
jgi:chromosome segregation protein